MGMASSTSSPKDRLLDYMAPARHYSFVVTKLTVAAFHRTFLHDHYL